MEATYETMEGGDSDSARTMSRHQTESSVETLGSNPHNSSKGE
jgi:hypothetical protein